MAYDMLSNKQEIPQRLQPFVQIINLNSLWNKEVIFAAIQSPLGLSLFEIVH